MDKLKPCPLCGGKGNITETLLGPTQYFIHCEKCDMETGLFNGKVVFDPILERKEIK